MPGPGRKDSSGYFEMPSGNRRLVTDEHGALITVSEQQHAIHEGTSYILTGHGTLAAEATAIFLGRVGAKQVHFDGFVAQLEKGGVHVHLYESPTITDPGTPATAYAKNRAIGGEPTTETYVAPTYSDLGTSIYDTLPPDTGSGANVQAATGIITEGWVLKANTDYLFTLENTDTNSSVDYDIIFEWHESGILFPVAEVDQ